MTLRLNKFIAQATGMSRRAADAAIAEGRVAVGNSKHMAAAGHQVAKDELVWLDGVRLVAQPATKTVLLNKPAGFVVSRDGQGSRTVYDLLPEELHHLKPVGRLDKDSSGLLILTNDGDLANRLTHPRFQKTKRYHVTLQAPLAPLHRQMISDYGVMLEDGPSKFEVSRLTEGDDTSWLVTMREGRNRQIRRTFIALGYTVVKLHRTVFGPYMLENTKLGQWRDVTNIP